MCGGGLIGMEVCGAVVLSRGNPPPKHGGNYMGATRILPPQTKAAFHFSHQT